MRSDVGAWLQDGRFTPSGYNLQAALPVGDYWIKVYAFSSVTSSFAVSVDHFVAVR